MEYFKMYDLFIGSACILQVLNGKAKSGTVWLFRAGGKGCEEDYRSDGHLFRQTGGAPAEGKRSTKFAWISRRVFHIVTKERPSGDSRFRKITWSNRLHPSDTLIQYEGMDELSTPQVHGNSKSNTRPRTTLAPSLMRRMEATTLGPRAMAELLTREAGPRFEDQHLGTPANDGQISDLKKNYKKRNMTVDQYEKLYMISLEYDIMRLWVQVPRLLLLLCEPEMVDYLREVLQEVKWRDCPEQVVSYDTQFDLGNFYLSSLTIRDPRLLTSRKSLPTVPAFFVIHERKLMYDHDHAFRLMVELVPELGFEMLLATSDNEFSALLGRHCKGSFVGKDENHMAKKIGRAMRSRKGTLEDVSFAKSEFRALIRCDTREEYDELYEERKKGWSPIFKQYWEKYIQRDIAKSGLWSAREIGYGRVEGLSKTEVPLNIFHSQQAESLNAVMAGRCGHGDVDLAEIVHLIRDYQRAFLAEVAKANMTSGKGQFTLKEEFREKRNEEKAMALLARVLGPSHEDIQKRAEDQRKRDELENTVRMAGRGVARAPGKLQGEKKLEEVDSDEGGCIYTDEDLRMEEIDPDQASLVII